MTVTSFLLAIESALTPTGWPSRHHIVEAISFIFKYNCEHPASVSGADKDDTQHVALPFHVASTTNLFDLLYRHPVAGYVSHIPWVPDKWTNEGHLLKLM